MATERCRRRALGKSALLGVVLAFLLLFLAQGEVAHAANFTVNSIADATDANVGDGVCETAPGNGVCTLRAAIQEANAFAGSDTITLATGTYTLTIAGAGEDGAATGDLDITDALTIEGAGGATTIVDGGGLDRVFHITATVTISGVTIRNGSLVFLGGGIFNLGTLTLNNSTVNDNSADSGGGIASGGPLTLNNSTVSGNSAGQQGGGIRSYSGGVTLTLNSSTVSGNSAGTGGGLFNDIGTVTVNNSTVSGNSALGGGGGIGNPFGTLTLHNSTVSANTAAFGGGISVDGVDPVTPPGTATLKNTIVANSPAGGNCAGPGSIISAGNNLDSDGTCGLGGPGDLSGVDPLLGPLADNGGPTQTHALLVGSLAIDAGSTGCPPPFTDQRGFARPVDGDSDDAATCDIGAYEFGATVIVQPDLTIAKTHTGTFVQGSTGNNYTVTVTNSGAGDKLAGQAVSVTEVPPSGLTVTAMSGTGWTCTTLPTCTRSDVLAAGTSYPAITVTVSVAANATSPQVNSVSVSTTQAESNTGNNGATDSTVITPVVVAQPDLTIAKTHTGSFVQGSTGNTYTVIVTNSGAGDKLAGQTVTVTEVPPAGLTVTAMSGTGWTCTAPTCTRSDVLAAGASYPPITVTVSVAANATSPQVNSVSVSTTQAESNTANNTATDSTIITTPAPQQPDLTITKTHTGNFVQGSTGTYTVIVTNSGAGDKTAGQLVTVTEVPPSGLTVTAMSGTGWTCTTLPTCTRSDVLAAGTSYPPITVTVSVAANATSPLVNSISVSTTQGESNAANNAATDSTIIIVAGSVQAIPTLSEWAIIGMGLLLAAAAVRHLRRHSPTHG